MTDQKLPLTIFLLRPDRVPAFEKQLAGAGEARLPLDTVARAKLVLNDDLIARTQRKSPDPSPPQPATQNRDP